MAGEAIDHIGLLNDLSEILRPEFFPAWFWVTLGITAILIVWQLLCSKKIGRTILLQVATLSFVAWKVSILPLLAQTLLGVTMFLSVVILSFNIVLWAIHSDR
jgi:hypothetical protein